jgi:hypothetical protein
MGYGRWPASVLPGGDQVDRRVTKASHCQMPDWHRFNLSHMQKTTYGEHLGLAQQRVARPTSNKGWLPRTAAVPFHSRRA